MIPCRTPCLGISTCCRTASLCCHPPPHFRVLPPRFRTLCCVVSRSVLLYPPSVVLSFSFSLSSPPLNSGQDFLPSPANVQTAASLRATAASVASETTGARVGSITYEAKEEGASSPTIETRARKEGGTVSASPRTRKEAELNRERSRSKDGTMGETRIVVSAAQESAAERVASFLQSETASPQTNFRVDDKDMNNSRSWGGGGH